MKNLLAIALFATASVTAAACVDMDGADPTDQDPGTEQPGKITVNSLLPTNISGSTLGLSALTGTSAHALGATSGGRALLSYIVDCALASTQSITITEGSLQYTYTGSMGLATGWTAKALNVDNQQLVTSCVLSRANYYGTSVAISDRGASATLATTGSELANYVLEEGAFYGNILNSTSGVAHACIGQDAIDHPDQGDLVNRKCAEQNGASGQTYCGFTYDGACSTACSTTVSGAGHYDGCSAWNDVVTTFVQN